MALALAAPVRAHAATTLDLPVTLEKVQAYLADPAHSSVDSVESFLAALPAEFKRNYVFMIDSKSTQGADKENPRVIMKSADAKTLITFNTSATAKGFNNIEVIRFDDTTKKFNFGEVVFGGKGKPGTFHPNDGKCNTCHGKDPRPNWDAYNFWPGQLPFNRDELFPGSYESKLYLDIYGKSKNDPRLKALQFPPAIVDGSFALRKDPNDRLRLPHDGTGDGPGVHFFDQAVELNGQRIAAGFKDEPNYEKWKYAVAGVAQGCGTPQDFLPPEARAASEKYFKTDLEGVAKDTKKRQDSLRDHKEERQKDILARMMFGKSTFSELSGKEKKVVDEEIARRPEGRENKETSSDTEFMSKMRYILEPQGVEVSKWSMSLEANIKLDVAYPATYTFADRVSAIVGPISQSLDLKKDIEAELAADDAGIARMKAMLDSAKSVDERLRAVGERLAEAEAGIAEATETLAKMTAELAAKPDPKKSKQDQALMRAMAETVRKDAEDRRARNQAAKAAAEKEKQGLLGEKSIAPDRIAFAEAGIDFYETKKEITQVDLIRLKKDGQCQLLKERSQRAYRMPARKAADKFAPGCEPEPKPMVPGQKLLAKITQKAIKDYQFPASCLECHTGEKSLVDLPFNDRDALRKLLLKGLKSNGGKVKVEDSPFYQELNGRIGSGNMPKTQGLAGPNGEKKTNQPLDSFEQDEMKAYLKFVIDPATLDEYSKE